MATPGSISAALVGLVLGTACAEKAPPETTAADPGFANEAAVTIRGYEGDAMEPFISRDGRYLFFNSLNDGQTTSLYYATRTSHTSFELQGQILGVNGPPPHLDAVASMDRGGLFYFVSTRNYPAEIRNYQRGRFAEGVVTEVSPVEGDFYVRTPGWLIMDAEISPDGDALYYVNARFRGGALPAEARLGIARRQGDSFGTDPDSDRVLENVNQSGYLVYAPSTTADGNELYFTRLQKGSTSTELCVAVRADPSSPYGSPRRLEIPGAVVEAPSLTADGRGLYYHKKLASDGRYHVFLMTRR